MHASSLSAVALALFATACSAEDPDSHQDSEGLVQCAAAPVCADHETQVDEAVDGARAVTVCGQTIHCAAEVAQCSAAPVCDEGEVQVSEGTDGAREVSLCGSTIWCGRELVTCTAVPSCDEGERPVAAGAEGAREVSLCGQTVWCAKIAEPAEGEDDPCPACGMG